MPLWLFFFTCVCLHGRMLNYKSEEILSSSSEKMKLCSICQTYFLNLFSQEQCVLGVIHVMTSSGVCFHTPASLHTPHLLPIVVKEKPCTVNTILFKPAARPPAQPLLTV